jgi:uncharacterized protein (TIGR03086 family)
MTEQELFVQANKALEAVVDQIKDDQWELTVPKEMTWRPETQTLRVAINYHTYDDAWVPDVLAGKTKEEVGAKYDGDLLGDDPKASYTKYAEAANEAVQAASDLDKIVHLSYGDFPARQYLQHIAFYRGLRAYDIAKFIGADTQLPGELVKGLYEMLEPQAEEMRKMGAIGPEVAVSKGAPLQDRLLALTGRQP